MDIEHLASNSHITNHPPTNSSRLKLPDQYVLSYNFQQQNSPNYTHNILLGFSNDHLPKVKKQNQSLAASKSSKNKLYSLIPDPKRIFRPDNKSVQKPFQTKVIQNMPKRYKELVNQKQNLADPKKQPSITKNPQIFAQKHEKSQIIIPKIQTKPELNIPKKQDKLSTPNYNNKLQNKQPGQKANINARSDHKNIQQKQNIKSKEKSPYTISTNVIKQRSSFNRTPGNLPVYPKNSQTQHAHSKFNPISPNQKNRNQHIKAPIAQPQPSPVNQVSSKDGQSGLINTNSRPNDPPGIKNNITFSKKDKIFQISQSSFRSKSKSPIKSRSQYNNSPPRSISRSPNSPKSPHIPSLPQGNLHKQKSLKQNSVKSPMQKLNEYKIRQVAKAQNDKKLMDKSKRSSSKGSENLMVNRLKNSFSESKSIRPSKQKAQHIQQAYKGDVMSKKNSTSKDYYRPHKSFSNNKSIGKMSQTLKSKPNMASTRTILSKGKEKPSVSVNSRSKGLSLSKSQLKQTSFYNKSPLKSQLNTNNGRKSLSINKSKSQSNHSYNSQNQSVSKAKQNSSIIKQQNQILSKHPRQLEINHEVEEESCFSEQKMESHVASLHKIKSKKEIQDQQLEEIQNRTRAQEPNSFKKANFHKTNQQEVLPFQNGIQLIFPKDSKPTINSKHQNQTAHKLNHQPKLSIINKNRLKAQLSSQNIKGNQLIKQKDIVKPKIITNKLQQKIKNDNLAQGNHQNILDQHEKKKNQRIDSAHDEKVHNARVDRQGHPLRRHSSNHKQIYPKKQNEIDQNIQDFTANNEIKGFKVAKNVVSIKPPVQIKRNSNADQLNNHVLSKKDSKKQAHLDNGNNKEIQQIDPMSNNQHNAPKNNVLKPTLPKTPLDKHHNFKNWKGAESQELKKQQQKTGKKEVIKKDNKSRAKVGVPLNKNKEKVLNVDLDMQQQDKFGVLAANRTALKGRKVEKNDAKRDRDGKKGNDKDNNNDSIGDEQRDLDLDEDHQQMQKMNSLQSNSQELLGEGHPYLEKDNQLPQNNGVENHLVSKNPQDIRNSTNNPSQSITSHQESSIKTKDTQGNYTNPVPDQPNKSLNIHQIHATKTQQIQSNNNTHLINSSSKDQHPQTTYMHHNGNKQYNSEDSPIVTQEIPFNSPQKINHAFEQSLNHEGNTEEGNTIQKNHEENIRSDKAPQQDFYSVPIAKDKFVKGNMKGQGNNDGVNVKGGKVRQSLKGGLQTTHEEYVNGLENTGNIFQLNSRSDDFLNLNTREASKNHQNISSVTYEPIDKDYSNYLRAPILSFVYQPEKTFIQMKDSFQSSNTKLSLSKSNACQEQDKIIEESVNILKGIDEWILQRIFEPYLTVNGQIGLWLYLNGSWTLFLQPYKQDDSHKSILSRTIQKMRLGDGCQFDLQKMLSLISGLRIIKLKPTNKKLCNEFEYSLKKKHLIRGISVKQNGKEKVFEIINVETSKEKENVIQLQDGFDKYWIKQQKCKALFQYFLLICNRQANFWTTKTLPKKDKHKAVLTLTSHAPAHGSITLYYDSPLTSTLYLYKELSSKVLRFIGKIQQKSNKNGNLYFEFRLQGKYYLFVQSPLECSLGIESTRQIQMGQIQYIKSQSLKNEECEYVELNQRQRRGKDCGMNGEDLSKLKEQFIRMIIK